MIETTVTRKTQESQDRFDKKAAPLSALGSLRQCHAARKTRSQLTAFVSWLTMSMNAAQPTSAVARITEPFCEGAQQEA